jgi:hypothetical protein
VAARSPLTTCSRTARGTEAFRQPFLTTGLWSLAIMSATLATRTWCASLGSSMPQLAVLLVLLASNTAGLSLSCFLLPTALTALTDELAVHGYE